MKKLLLAGLLALSTTAVSAGHLTVVNNGVHDLAFRVHNTDGTTDQFTLSFLHRGDSGPNATRKYASRRTSHVEIQPVCNGKYGWTRINVPEKGNLTVTSRGALCINADYLWE